jgi:hypothetical protein
VSGVDYNRFGEVVACLTCWIAFETRQEQQDRERIEAAERHADAQERENAATPAMFRNGR